MFTRNDLSGKILHGWLQLTNTQSITWCKVHTVAQCLIYRPSVRFSALNTETQAFSRVYLWSTETPCYHKIRSCAQHLAACNVTLTQRCLVLKQLCGPAPTGSWKQHALRSSIHYLLNSHSPSSLAVTSLTTMLQTEISPPRSELIPSMQITIVCDVTPLCLVCDDVYRGTCFLRGWRHTSLQNIGTYIPDYVNFQKTYSGPPNHTTGTFVFQWKSVVHYGTPVQPQWNKFAWLLIETSLVVLKLVMSHVTTWNLSSEFSVYYFV